MGASELVGRKVEAAALRAALADARPAVLLGESGIGKTSLIESVLADDGRPVRRGGGLATLAWMPYLAVARALGRTSFEVDEAAAVADVVEREVGADILFVDDLHACDPGSLEVVALLSRRLTLVAAVRLGDAGTAAALDVVRGIDPVTIEVSPLSDDDAREVARRVRPTVGADELERVVHRSGGVPLLVEELAAGRDEATLARALRSRLSFLDDDARGSALLLAVSGRPVGADIPGADVLVEARVAVRPGPGLLSVRHALLAEALLEEASDDEVRACHASLAARAVDPVVRAHHLLRCGDHAAAYDVARAEAHRAESPGRRAEALLLAACAAGARDEADGESVTLMVRAAEQLVTAGRARDASEVLRAVAARHVEDAALAGRAAALRARAAWMEADVEGFSSALVECEALDGVVPPDVRVDLLFQRVTHAILLGGDWDAAQALCDEHVRAATDARHGLAGALMRRAALLSLRGDAGALEALEAALAQARAEQDLATELPAANNLVDGLISVGRLDEAYVLAVEQAEQAGVQGLVDWRHQFQAMAAVAALYLGRPGTTLALADEVEGAARDPRTLAQVRNIRVSALVELGLSEQVVEAAPKVRALYGDAAPEIRAASLTNEACALWQLGRLDEAAAVAEGFDLAWRGDVAEVMRHVVDWLALERGLVPEPFVASTSSQSRALTVAVALENEGVRALATDDAAAAAGLFDRAAEVLVSRWKYAEMRCRWAAAESRRRAGGDVVDELVALEARLADLGYGALLKRAQRSLRLAGVSRPSARTTDRSSLLSAREQHVLRLAAEGLSDPEIARALALGVPTVRRHVSNAAVKLGVPTRTAAVAVVASATRDGVAS